MTDSLEFVLSRIETANPIHAKKLAADLSQLGTNYRTAANEFLGRYAEYLAKEGKDLEYAVTCYLKFLDDILIERIHFVRTGKYTNTSFDEVNAQVYANPEVMTYHMHALLLSQFLWHQHFKMLQFFEGIAEEFAPGTNRYLEIGAGHGLYVRAFCHRMPEQAVADVMDISETSLSICKEMTAATDANFLQANVLEYEAPPYDFITMGEVLEHVEDPRELLERLKGMCTSEGHIFITTPTNAPTIDHIYLFEDVDQIRDLISSAGLRVVKELPVVTEEIKTVSHPDIKIATLYGALLQPVH